MTSPLIPDGRTADRCRSVAQVAIQAGRHAARQLTRTFGRAGRPEPFRYKDKGTMATIGRRAAVAEFPNGFTLRGTLGWWSWLGLHLVYLIGFRNRLSVMVNWTWNYFTWDRGPEADPLGRPPRPSAVTSGRA